MDVKLSIECGGRSATARFDASFPCAGDDIIELLRFAIQSDQDFLAVCRSLIHPDGDLCEVLAEEDRKRPEDATDNSEAVDRLSSSEDAGQIADPTRKM